MAEELESAEEESLKQVLRPLVRNCIRSSNRIQYFIKVLKAVYIEVAAEEISRGEDKINMSRINVMTGVQRIDIAKIYKKKEPLKASIGDTVQRVIGQWTGDEQFLTKDGKPRILGYSAKQSDFADLVAKVTTSVGPAAVLYELERANAVERTKTGVKLITTTLRHGKNRGRVSRMLGESVEALMTASFENGLAEKDDVPHLHIRTQYDNVFVKDVPRIQAWLKREGRKFHKRAREYIAKYDKDISENRNDPAGAVVVLGAFSLTSEEPRPELIGGES